MCRALVFTCVFSNSGRDRLCCTTDSTKGVKRAPRTCCCKVFRHRKQTGTRNVAYVTERNSHYKVVISSISQCDDFRPLLNSHCRLLIKQAQLVFVSSRRVYMSITVRGVMYIISDNEPFLRAVFVLKTVKRTKKSDYRT